MFQRYSKQAVTKMVQEAMTYLEKTPSMNIKLKLIDTLRTVTAGKVCSLRFRILYPLRCIFV